MVFNGLLIIFDIRSITQWAYLFISTPVKKLQPIVSSILGHIYSIVSFLQLKLGSVQLDGISGYHVDQLQI